MSAASAGPAEGYEVLAPGTLTQAGTSSSIDVIDGAWSQAFIPETPMTQTPNQNNGRSGNGEESEMELSLSTPENPGGGSDLHGGA